MNLESWYKYVNQVKPSFIRVEADELTYNFHIILRFELEQDLMNGDLAVKDVPAAWNGKMEELLGVVPPNDSLPRPGDQGILVSITIHIV